MTPALETILLPIASEKDAEATCRAALTDIDPRRSRVVVVHVIERRSHHSRGPRSQAFDDVREARAERIFDRASERFAEVGLLPETRLEYATDVVDAIYDVADEEDASAIVFTPRGAGRWKKLLSGDIAHKIVHRADRPVVVFPPETEG